MQSSYPQAHHTESSKKKFSKDEDEKLKRLVIKYGSNKWRTIASSMPGRTSRQCRERWKYYLSKSPVVHEWSHEEDELLIQKYAEYGSHWAQLTKFFPDRTDINLKNHFKKLQRIGIASSEQISPDISIQSNSNGSSQEYLNVIPTHRIIDLPVPLSQLLSINAC